MVKTSSDTLHLSKRLGMVWISTEMLLQHWFQPIAEALNGFWFRDITCSDSKDIELFNVFSDRGHLT
jgi:hypothetical protein